MTRTKRERLYALLACAAVAGAVPGQVSAQVSATRTISCSSAQGEQQHCAGNTASGVLLVSSPDPYACLLGRTWGYDDSGVWVRDGCSGEFQVADRVVVTAPKPGKPVPVEDLDQVAVAEPVVEKGIEPDLAALNTADASSSETWGVFDPGNGFLVGRSDLGELSLSAYALVRYMNQMGDNSFDDHLGREREIDRRNDIYSHRAIVYLKGWMMDPKFVYNIAFWTVNATDQDALFGNMGYRFDEKFNLYAGINGTPGSRSLQGSHPYWLGHDRVMADEFFRPYFAQGIWANGELAPGLWYNAMMGNTSSTLGVTASAIDRDFSYGASMWWMPTTHEFGPRGAYGDWEMHEELATRFGFSTAYSPEERYTDVDKDSDNTTLKLADSVNIFETGALAPGVTITDADYVIAAVDAGFKYRGFFFQTEFYHRWLDGFRADGELPVDGINDWGFYVQSSYYPIPKTLELYAATSQIFGDDGAGFDDSSEYLVGMNYYPWNSRNYRLNLQIMDVNHSPVGSTFGYYTSGQNGMTVSTAFSMFF